MLRKCMKVAVAGALGLLAVVVAVNGSNGADEKTDTKSVMKASFGKGGFKTSIPAAAKDGKWEDAQKLAKEWNALGTALAKNKPNKGEAKGWEEQCAKFADATKAVLKATEDKDAKAVGKAVGGFNCKACHDAHK